MPATPGTLAILAAFVGLSLGGAAIGGALAEVFAPGSWIAAVAGFFATVPQEGRLDEIRLVLTAANRQPALAAYALTDGGAYEPYGLMVLQIEGDLISGIVGFPDPWLFEQCGLPTTVA